MPSSQTLSPLWKTVAVVGTGVIGRSWAKIFSRAGCRTRLYDRDPAQVQTALAWLKESLAEDQAEGTMSATEAEACLARISAHKDLAEALQGADYVQESGPENLAVKQALYVELDRLAAPTAVLGSSTSAMDMTEIAAHVPMPGRARCIVSHPTNPPHVAPATEIVPGKDTAPDVLARTKAFMISIGQTPVVMNHFVTGFILNRLQAALLREAISLVDRGVADADSVDAVVRDGLGLRWALMGPYGVAATNADGGVAEYLTRYGGTYCEIWKDLSKATTLSPETIAKVGKSSEQMLGGMPLGKLRAWRDRMLRRIAGIKRQDPPPWKEDQKRG